MTSWTRHRIYLKREGSRRRHRFDTGDNGQVEEGWSSDAEDNRRGEEGDVVRYQIQKMGRWGKERISYGRLGASSMDCMHATLTWHA